MDVLPWTARADVGRVLALLVLGLTAAAPGRIAGQSEGEVDDTAAPASGISAAQDAEYRQLVADGVAEFGRGNWSEARAFFSRAHALKPSARTLRGLGLVAYELRNYVEAESLLERALRENVHTLTGELRAQTEETLAKARTLIGRFRLRTTPADARVSVDGQEAEVRAGELALSAGPHRLLAQRAGFTDAELRIDVRGGEQETLELRLRPDAELAVARAPDAATSARAFTRVTASPGPARPERGDDDGGSIFASPWFWAAAVAVVAGGVASALVLTADAPEPRAVEPSTGVLFVKLTEGR